MFILLASAQRTALAQTFTIGKLQVENPRLRESDKGENRALLSMVIRNSGDAPDTLVCAKSDRLGKALLHISSKHIVTPKGIVIPPHAAVLLEPGRPLVSFEEMTEAISLGRGDEIKLVFEKSGELTIVAAVETTGLGRVHGKQATER